MVSKTQTNLFLIISNITALTFFSTPPNSWTNPFLMLLTYIPINLYKFSKASNPEHSSQKKKQNQQSDIKLTMQIISALAIFSAFIVNPIVSDFFTVLSLGLALNVGYSLDSVHAPWGIHCAIGIGIVLGFWCIDYTSKYSTARDVILLIFTLPNLFIAQNSKKKTEKKILHLINPYYDGQWTFALGFISGIFLPVSHTNPDSPQYSPNITRNPLFEKSTRFFLIALILFISIFLDQNAILYGILAVLRGTLTYTQSKHEAEFFFLIGFVCIKLLLKDVLLNYMFIGYLIVGVILWQTGQYTSIRRGRYRNHPGILMGTKNNRNKEDCDLSQPLMREMQEIKR